MLEITRDKTCVIVDRGPGMVEYLSDDGTRWRMYGTCNMCGSCEAGGYNQDISFIGEIGTPNACLNIAGEARLDNPCRPDISEIPGCTLTGEYI